MSARRFPFDMDLVRPASYYAAQDAARLAAEAAVTPEERAADAWWDALPPDARTAARRRFSAVLFEEGCPGLAVLAYRAECAQ